jgi:CubicO group peptidase (beta-lactamase class C family)
MKLQAGKIYSQGLMATGMSYPIKFWLSSAVFAFLVFCTSAHGQDKTSDVDKIFSWATSNSPGCACVISQNGKVVVNRAYGSADLERGFPITPETVFDIGSTRKQFIAAAVLLLVQERSLSLSDDIRKFVPELPDYGQKITIDHLLTHTSGIRDWTGLMPLANGDPTALTLILRQRGLNFIPGEEWSYCNSGYVLLTEIVTRVTGVSFSEFVRKRVFEPLGMIMTTYVSDMQQVIKSRALGYEKEANGWKINMYLGNDRGGGAIFSTANDLDIWNNALSGKKLGEFVTKKLQEPAMLNNGRKLGYARGLTLDPYRDLELVWHSGGAAGYHSWLGRIPSEGLSIAVLCNSDAVAATALANRLLPLFVSSPGTPPAEDGPPPALTGDVLQEINKLAGLYLNEETGESIRLSVDRDRFRIAGGPGLAPVAKGRYRRWGTSVFYRSQDKFELNFLSENQFELKSMEGVIQRYSRALPHTHTSAELETMAGRYQNDEIGAFFDMTSVNGVLRGRANDAPGEGFQFTPVSRDTFQLGGVTLVFIRDKAGKVVALNYSNPVVRNIRFIRE